MNVKELVKYLSSWDENCEVLIEIGETKEEEYGSLSEGDLLKIHDNRSISWHDPGNFVTILADVQE